MLEDPWAEFQEDNSEQTESRSEEIAIEEETCTWTFFIYTFINVIH